MPKTISNSKLQDLLAISDLTTDDSHAISLMVKQVSESILLPGPVRLVKGSRIVPARNNYELLGYAPDAIVQESTYTHWVDDNDILRTQTTSLILEALLKIAPSPPPMSLLAPGIVYRRDVRDRWHCAQPHQIDLWHLMPKHEESQELLLRQVYHLVEHTTGMEEKDIQINPTSHPYTEHGVEVSVRWQDRWLEVGEAGLISPSLLGRLGIDSEHWGGLAMGWGLDRLVMARKMLPDIRLLRDPLPSIARQMTNLDPWQEVSRQPSASREISVALHSGLNEEDITEKILGCISPAEALLIQSIDIIGRWSADDLQKAARLRLGINPGQENILIKVVWQSESQSLGRKQVNASMRNIYRGIHQGSGWDYCP